MNLNDYELELKQEEQKVLDKLISKMDKVIAELDENIKEYVLEAKRTDESLNPDDYGSRKWANNALKSSKLKKNTTQIARDELYHTRLLLKICDDDGITDIEEIKIGLHSCQNGSDMFVTSWKMPICRHYIMDNPSTEFRYELPKDKRGDVRYSDFTLLVKESVDLRFTKVVKAMNLFPGIFDDNLLKKLQGRDFFSDEFLEKMLQRFNPEEYNPDEVAQIISDEFLAELLERRSSLEFKNIVFSIQRKQGEIIQAPYAENMVVQGCAGSGKSMIMLHRLPIILYDNPNSIGQSNIYIITPSEMYIEMAENMRRQLEISAIDMGTLEQYYDSCISLYVGHKPSDYGKKGLRGRSSQDLEEYVYSEVCIKDIINFLEKECWKNNINLNEARSKLGLAESFFYKENTFSSVVGKRLSELGKIISANQMIIKENYQRIHTVVKEMQNISRVFNNRQDEIRRELRKKIDYYDELAGNAAKEIKKLDANKNAIAIKSRQDTIELAQLYIIEYQEQINKLDIDDVYFENLKMISGKITSILEPFSLIKDNFNENMMPNVYNLIEKTSSLKDGLSMIKEEILKVGDKYSKLAQPVNEKLDKLVKAVNELDKMDMNYLDIDYYGTIKELKDTLTYVRNNVVKNTYLMVMQKLKVKPTAKGSISALECSPYLYLQILYQYYGELPNGRRSLLFIDEAQGIAVEEIRLLKHVNGDNVIFNLFGDERQHIERTKGISNWTDLEQIMEFKRYDMQENYRNASQITEYCNKRFRMNMLAINTPGQGINEIKDENTLKTEIEHQLFGVNRVGLAAIIVSNKFEAQYILDVFSPYIDKFNDMTGDNFSLHKTRWNILLISDASGLEFNSVIALSGRMSENEKYIAYTRALDELLVYDEEIEIEKYQSYKKPSEVKKISKNETSSHEETLIQKHSAPNIKIKKCESEVREFFESQNLEVIDDRITGGRLWVIGEKSNIREIVNTAIEKFNISGKYASDQITKGRAAWCSKTTK